MVIKKRKSETKSVEKHTIQTNVCSSLKSVYFSKDEASIKRAVEQICELFLEISSTPTKIEYFLKEVQFRLDFLIDNKTGQTARVRCLRTISLCAIQLMLTNHIQLLDFITSYCQQLSNAESIVIRQYVCIFIGIFYKTARQSTDEFCSESLLPQKHYRQFFSILKSRWLDISSSVRREAIRSLSFLQNDAVSADHEEAVERSPRDMLMTSLGDCAPECREEAVKCVMISDTTLTKLILNVAQRDQDLRVKKSALLKVLSDEKFEEISPKSRVEILEHLFGPRQQALNDVTVDLLLQWVKSAGTVEGEHNNAIDDDGEHCKVFDDSIVINGTLHFLRSLDIIKKEKICEQALAMVLQNLAEQKNGLINVISVITDFSNECLHRNNFKELLNAEVSIKEKALLLFHWRVVMELCCVEYEKREDQKSICLFKLVPTLQTFTKFVSEFLELFALTHDSSDETLRGSKKKVDESRQFCMIQLFRILHCLEKEPVGMDSWNKLLFSVLGNVNVRLGFQFVQEIVESIMHVHYFRKADAETALHEFCDTINSFVQSDNQGTNFNSQLSPEYLSPSRFTYSTTDFNNTVNATQTIKMDEVTRERCLIILNAMLRSGFFKKVSAELQGLCETILNDSYVSKSVEIRSLALECLGVVSLRDESYAKMHICLVEQALNVDLKAVKLTCLKVLTDLVTFYGYHKISKWYSRFDEDDDDAIDTQCCETQLFGNSVVTPVGTQNIKEKFIELSTAKDVDIAFCATDALCKWCLSVDDIYDWHNVVYHLLLLSFRDECKNNPRLQACLSRFMPLFAAVSRRNQTLLADVFILAMNALKERDLECELTSVSEIALAESVLKFTSFDVLSKDAAFRNKGSAHSHLAKVVLSGLKANADDYFAGIYCKMLSNLEMNEDLEEVELGNLIFLCTEVFNDVSDDAKNMRFIQQFLKRLTALRDQVRTSSRVALIKSNNKIKLETPTSSIADVFNAHLGTIDATAIKAPVNSNIASSFITPQKILSCSNKGTVRSSTKKKTNTYSIVSLTSELSINRKKDPRKRGLDNTTPSCVRRPVIERAAKTNARGVGAYRPDDTIIEEDENDSFKSSMKSTNFMHTPLSAKNTLSVPVFESSDDEEFV